MALAPTDAFTFAQIYVKNSRLSDVEVRILDDVNKIMWMAAPWRWTVDSMPLATLAANTQDYAITLPADFLFLHEAYLQDQNNTLPRPLIVEAVLPTSTKFVGQPSRVAISGSNYRISPVPGSLVPATTTNIVGLYKKQAPSINNGNMGTPGVQVFPDEWFPVYQAGVLWKAYQYADDDRAGNVTFADGKVQYTGQRAEFEDGLNKMRQSEKLSQLPKISE